MRPVQNKDSYPLLTPDEARHELARKGWTAKLLATWWGFSHEHVLRMIADPKRKRRDDDAIRGLPMCPASLRTGPDLLQQE